MKKNSDFVCHFDGSCYPNPGGDVGVGAVVRDEKRVVHTVSYKMDKNPLFHTSSNVAEYMAFIDVLLWFNENRKSIRKRSVIDIYGDSQLVVEQMNRRWRIKEGIYYDYAMEAQALLFRLQRWFTFKIRWIPRDQNIEADVLSKPK